jgi:hypothetical protein
VLPGEGGSPEEDGPTGFIGSPCESTTDCNYAGAICLTDDEGYPDGLCTQGCDQLCPDLDGHPTTFCPADPAGFGPECRSRCDDSMFPGTGCRNGYACRLLERAGDPGVQFSSCIVDDNVVQETTSCIGYLIDRGVAFEQASYSPSSPDNRPDLTCSLEEPVTLQSPVLGIDICTSSRCSSMLMACPLARAIVDMTDVLRDYGITQVTHRGTVSCRTIGGSDRLSQHALGRAIDISGFTDVNGQSYDVGDDWEQDNTDPQTTRGRLLYDVVHELHDEGIFNIILTPDYNEAHRTVFHLDLTEGADFLKRDDAVR